MSKGSSPRPLAVDTRTYAARWEATFRPHPAPVPVPSEIEADVQTPTPEAPRDE